MSKGIIIAGFATVGKTFLSKKYKNIIDFKSSPYKYDYSSYENIDYEKLKGTSGRKENKEWPYNYYNVIKEKQNYYDIVFVQLNLQHLEYFDNNNIEYYIAYPALDSWEWVKQRSINRGNNEKWIKRLEEVFEEYYIASKKSKCKEIFIVNEQTSLEDILKKKEFI
ncbi:MAG: hypothetical protein V8R01_01235 [Bacilli bacterium]